MIKNLCIKTQTGIIATMLHKCFFLYQIFLFLLLLFGFSKNANAQSCNMNISGKVIDFHDQEPLSFAGVYVELQDKGVYTKEDGTFELSGICEGEIHLVISHLNCEPKKISFYLTADTSLTIVLQHHTEMLSTITVEDSLDDFSFGTTHNSIQGKQLERLQGKPLADILAKIPGVNTLKSGSGISKPMIHGMYGNRIQIINNDVTQEGQAWGQEHAPEIDPFTAGKISVIKGVSAIKYGSNAIGGVILVEPSRLGGDRHLHGKVALIGANNGKQYQGSILLNGGIPFLKRMQWRAQTSYKKAGDTFAPNYSLTNTGVEEHNYSFTTAYTGKKVYSELYYSNFTSQIAILRSAHIGNLTDLENAFNRSEPFYTEDFSYDINNPKQQVQHQLLKSKTEVFFSDDVNLILKYSYQKNSRKEFDIRRGGRSEIPALDLLLTTKIYELNLAFFQTKKIRSEIGYNYKRQINITASETGVRPLIPNFSLRNQTVFGIVKWIPSKLTQFELGLRYDFKTLGVKKYDRQNYLIDTLHYFDNYSASFGFMRKINEHLTYRTNLAFAYRAPQANELYSEGLHHGLAAIEEGDINLKNEQSVKFVNTFSYIKSDKFNVNLTLYSHYAKNYIYLQPQSEPRLTVRGAFPVFLYKQTDVLLNGMDLAARLKLHKNLFWDGKLSVLRARNITEDEYLVLMPADNASANFVYRKVLANKTSAFEFSLGGKYVAKQWRVPQDEDFAPPPEGYFLMNAEISAEFKLKKQEFRIYLIADNLLNTSYRDYLNRLRYYADDMGRNIQLKLNFLF